MPDCVHIHHTLADHGIVFCSDCHEILGHWYYNDPDQGDFRVIIENAYN